MTCSFKGSIRGAQDAAFSASELASGRGNWLKDRPGNKIANSFIYSSEAAETGRGQLL